MAAGRGAAVLDAGEAWFETVGVRGAVCGVFRQAAYLRFDDRILALCRPEVPSGPLHLRTHPFPALALGQPARLSGRRLEVGRFRVDLVDEHRWAPPRFPLGALRRRTATSAAGRADPAIGLASGLVRSAARLVEGDDLPGLARLVGGRGPGLTPAGDDLLAGVLVAHAILHPEDDAEEVRREAAATARTNDVATAFLREAARGRCIAPVHDLLAAMAYGRADGEAAARAHLVRIGGSSGAALMLGVDLVVDPEDQQWRNACATQDEQGVRIHSARGRSEPP